MQRRLRAIEEADHFGDRKSLRGGLHELRFRQGLRIYFTELGGRIVLLIGGSGKGSQSRGQGEAQGLQTTNPGMIMATSRALKIKDELYEDLRDPAYAAAYLNEALLEGDEVVLKTALADVVKAQGVQRVAKRAGINRVTVYKTLRPETESSFTVMRRLLAACGVSLTVQPSQHRGRRAS